MERGESAFPVQVGDVQVGDVQVLGHRLASSQSYGSFHIWPSQKTKPIGEEVWGTWGVISMPLREGSAGQHETPHFSGSCTSRAWMVRGLAGKIKPTPRKRDEQWRKDGAASLQAGFDSLALVIRKHRALVCG